MAAARTVALEVEEEGLYLNIDTLDDHFLDVGQEVNPLQAVSHLGVGFILRAVGHCPVVVNGQHAIGEFPHTLSAHCAAFDIRAFLFDIEYIPAFNGPVGGTGSRRNNERYMLTVHSLEHIASKRRRRNCQTVQLGDVRTAGERITLYCLYFSRDGVRGIGFGLRVGDYRCFCLVVQHTVNRNIIPVPISDIDDFQRGVLSENAVGDTRNVFSYLYFLDYFLIWIPGRVLVQEVPHRAGAVDLQFICLSRVIPRHVVAALS